jgi:hypothetical protein
MGVTEPVLIRLGSTPLKASVGIGILVMPFDVPLFFWLCNVSEPQLRRMHNYKIDIYC